MLGHEVTKATRAARVCPTDTIDLTFAARPGRASGRSCRAGVTLRLEGDTNDYFGKGLSGGTLIVVRRAERGVRRRGEHHRRQRHRCYGATGARCSSAARSGERFCVRNSGATAVVEGVGDHACEYMTGGAR